MLRGKREDTLRSAKRKTLEGLSALCAALQKERPPLPPSTAYKTTVTPQTRYSRRISRRFRFPCARAHRQCQRDLRRHHDRAVASISFFPPCLSPCASYRSLDRSIPSVSLPLACVIWLKGWSISRRVHRAPVSRRANHEYLLLRVGLPHTLDTIRLLPLALTLSANPQSSLASPCLYRRRCRPSRDRFWAPWGRSKFRHYRSGGDAGSPPAI
ncbi:hypothetical protein R3P38DRAFT_723202 [Favolaschia claudopus]|uniref:Uncharacterized protein n=1 Tax=Favolaschia claudopus TaxID=2862362 RepID=A0AAV9Z427_9AGAR